jgi:MOSC domain-containing protein YiiM
MDGLVVGLQVGMPEKVVAWEGEEAMFTGLFKRTVQGPVFLTSTGLAGDGQADLRHHGGPDKAVNAYPSEHYPYWQEYLQLGDLPEAAFGENLTTEGLLEQEICLGDVFSLGSAVLQVSQPRQPCWKLNRRYDRKDLVQEVLRSGRTGWYFRVLQQGLVSTGQPLRLIERAYPDWTILRACALRFGERDEAALAILASLPVLSVSWREELTRRL